MSTVLMRILKNWTKSSDNNISENFKSEQEKAFERLELHYACEFNQENKYFDTLNKFEGLKKEIEQNINDIGEKEEKIREIEAQLSDIARVADKINQHLRSMFSKEHIKIEAMQFAYAAPALCFGLRIPPSR